MFELCLNIFCSVVFSLCMVNMISSGLSFYPLNSLWYRNRSNFFLIHQTQRRHTMSQPSKIAQLGILNILNQMKNPLTNIRLCVDMLDDDNYVENTNCKDIIKNSAISLENSIRDLCSSFADLGITIHLESDKTIFKAMHAD